MGIDNVLPYPIGWGQRLVITVKRGPPRSPPDRGGKSNRVYSEIIVDLGLFD